MAEVAVCAVTRANWRDTLRLAVAPEQQRFVADVVPIAALVLAKAYIRPAGLTWVPYAFAADTTLIGCAALAYEPGSAENYWLCHFFIDQRYQGHGYGRQALQAMLQLVRDRHAECRRLCLTVHPENVAAQRLYTSAGFRATGEERFGEPVYMLPLAPSPSPSEDAPA